MEKRPKFLVLDTNILLAHPEVIESKLKGAELIVPRSVIDELRNASGQQSRFEILASAVESSQSITLVHGTTNNFPKSIRKDGIGGFDILTLGAVFDSAASGRDTVFVTNDTKLGQRVAQAGIATATGGILQEFSKIAGGMESSAAARYKAQRNNARYLFAAFSFGSGIVVTVIVENISKIVEWIQVAWRQYPSAVALAPIIFAVLAHAGKRRQQFLYGTIEVIIGALACYTTTVFISSAGNHAEGLTIFLTYASAAFIIIRGLGNMNDGLNLLIEYPKAVARLRWILDPARAYSDAKGRVTS